MNSWRFADKMISFLIIQIIRLYQATLSPDHGPFRYKHPAGYCRFQPTCSQYSIEAFEKYGVFKGLRLSVSRILRCNPWSKGGYDPLK